MTCLHFLILPDRSIEVQYIRYTSEYIPKLQIHKHSLLTRKVFSQQNSSAQVFFSRSPLDHHQIWMIIGSSSKLYHHWIIIKAGSSLDHHKRCIIIGSSSKLDHHWIVIKYGSSLDHHQLWIITGSSSKIHHH